MVNPNAGNYPSLNILQLQPVAACAPAPTFVIPPDDVDYVVRFDTAAAAPQPTFHTFRIVQ